MEVETHEYNKMKNEKKNLVRTWALDQNQAQMCEKLPFSVKKANLARFGG